MQAEVLVHAQPAALLIFLQPIALSFVVCENSTVLEGIKA